jgi:hypothetical protein
MENGIPNRQPSVLSSVRHTDLTEYWDWMHDASSIGFSDLDLSTKCFRKREQSSCDQVDRLKVPRIEGIIKLRDFYLVTGHDLYTTIVRSKPAQMVLNHPKSRRPQR